MASEAVRRSTLAASAAAPGHGASLSRDPQGVDHVADDLEAIFGSQVLHPPTHMTAAPEPEMPAGPLRLGRRGGTILGGLFVAVVAGALFAFVLDGPELGLPAPGPAPAPKVVANEWATAAANPDRALRQAAGAEEAATAAIEATSVPPAPSLKTVQQPLRVALRPSLPIRAPGATGADAPADGCARGSGYEEAQCGHAAVMAADLGLRRAYARARRAGVSGPDLADYNDQWVDLLNNAETSPLGVAAGYSALASQLDRLAAVAENDRDDDLPEL